MYVYTSPNCMLSAVHQYKYICVRYSTDLKRALNIYLKCITFPPFPVNDVVGNELTVKLADFGMARGVQDKDLYRLAGKAKLPVKWMAPESLLYGEFTPASDVWYVYKHINKYTLYSFVYAYVCELPTIYTHGMYICIYMGSIVAGTISRNAHLLYLSHVRTMCCNADC